MTQACVLIVDDDVALLQALPETVRLRMDGGVKQQPRAPERTVNERKLIVGERTPERRQTDEVIERRLPWFVGAGPQMEKIAQQSRQVADSPLTVLVEGETGTTKKLVVRA